MYAILRPVAVLLCLIPAAAFAQEAPNPAIVSVQGLGEVSAAPDIAFVNSGVTTQAKTAREALDANSAAMTELVSVLKAAGIEDRDIQTSNFSVQPNYTYSDQRDSSGYPRPPRIDGYTVSNSVTVRVRDLDSLGPVLDQAVSVGANTINGISFSVDDPSGILNEARRKAVADAVARAGLYADAAGVTLGRIVTINENSGFAPAPKALARMDMVAAEASVPVQAGELTYSATVTMQWEISQ